jgi:hypothetical protein
MTTPTTPITPFSPAAQSIVKAFDDRYELLGPLESDWQEQCIAAALYATADLVAPKIDPPYSNSYTEGMYESHMYIRRQLLVIASKLESCK